jgi:type I restriction enzyme S subunit
MAKDGASCLETVCVFDQPDELVLLSSVAIFRPSPSLDAHFLRYYLEWPQTKALLRGGYVSGSAIPRVVLRDFKAAPVPLPPLPTQLAIARVLGALDDKIELDRKMNETLEQMARAIFKSWFVDFEPFRDKGMVDSSLGKIPKGWEVKALGEVAERVAMGPFGSSIKVDTFVVEGIPVISGQHLWGIMLNDLNYNFVTPEHADKLSNANVYRGDVVFTHAGSIGQVAWIPESSKYERYVISQRQFYMRCDLAKVCPSYVVYYFSSPEGQHKLLANTSSSGVPSISRPVTYLRSIQMPVPPRRVLEEFEGAVRPVHLQMRSQVAQSRTLAAIRDALLPKLMSGEVRVETRTA